MLRRIVRTLPGAVSLATLLLLASRGSAGAQAVVYDEFYLRAETVNQTMPDGRVVPMWGFALTNSLFAGGTAIVPGPPLTLVPGHGLKIHLKNQNIPEGISIVIPGQAAPTDGVNPPQVVRNPDGRARAFTHEAAPGANADYVWDSLRPGTFLYQSGSHPAVQVQMGLFGALENDAAPSNAYGLPLSAYAQDRRLLYSEIDPALHDAVAAGQYGPGRAVTSTLDYEPKYFLVNGQPHQPGRSPLALSGGTVLVRFLNAGLETHLPAIGGASFTLVAEDGGLLPVPRQSSQVELHAGRTVDAMLGPLAEGYYPIYDRKLSLVSDLEPDRGMIAYLRVPSAATATLNVAKSGSGNGRVVIASLPGGINCGTDCSETFNRGTRVTLRGLPGPSSLLTGWSGGGAACAGYGDCVTTLNNARTVTATFTAFSAVTVATPNGGAGESFPERSLITIRWGAPATAATFALHYSINGGLTWNQIDRGVEGRSYVWEIPAVASTRPNCLVRVRGYSASRALIGSDVSDYPFAIVNVP